MPGLRDRRWPRESGSLVTTSTFVRGNTGVGSRKKRSRGGSKLYGRKTLLFLVPGGVYLLLFAAWPLIDLFMMAFSNVTAFNLLGDRPFNGLDNARYVLSDPTLGRVIVQTLIVVAVILVVSLVGGFLAALALKKKTKLATFTLGVMVFVWTLPAVIGGNLWIFLLAGDGPINVILLTLNLIEKPLPFLSNGDMALASVSLITAWSTLPFCTLVLRAAFLDVPEELVEAAAIDGASGWKLNRFVVIPLLRPVILILSVLLVINAFKTFELIFVMTGGGPGTSTTTLQYLIYQQAFTFYEFGRGAFTALLSLVIVGVLGAIYIHLNKKEEAAK